MSLFKKRIKKKRKKRQSTDEQKFRRAELKRKKYLEDALVEMAEKDPAFKRQLVADTFGIKLPDPCENRNEELKALVNDKVIQEVEDDPELARKIARAKLYQMMTAEGLTADSEEMLGRPSRMQQQIARFREINELKDVLGIREPGILETLTNPGVVIAFLSLLSSVFGGKESLPATEEKVLVQINDEIKIITMSEFKRLQGEGRVQKTAEEESPGHDIQDNGDNTPHEIDTPEKTEEDIGPLQS